MKNNCISTVRILMANICNSHPLINNSFIDLPALLNISPWWNFVSLLGICLVYIYTSHTITTFSFITHTCWDMNYEWLTWYLHINRAPIVFTCLFFHLGRGLYYGSYPSLETWNIGIILFTIIVIAFVGCILPWGLLRSQQL